MKKVAVLLACYNGEEYIREQIISILEQRNVDVTIYISDDGSTDSTLNIINKLKKKYPEKIYLFNGPKRGFAQNFLSLIRNEIVSGDFYAYSDQDDIWMDSKLEKGTAVLNKFSNITPNLYCSRTINTDRFLNIISMSPIFKRKPSLRNSLVQNLASGNTMVFNEATRQLLKKT